MNDEISFDSLVKYLKKRGVFSLSGLRRFSTILKHDSSNLLISQERLEQSLFLFLISIMPEEARRKLIYL